MEAVVDDLMMRSMDTARQRGAQYADVRVVDSVAEFIAVKNGVIETLTTTESVGFGVRVLANNAWGFASSRDLTAAEADRMTDLAFQIAQASPLDASPNPGEMGPPVTSRGSHTTPI